MFGIVACKNLTQRDGGGDPLQAPQQGQQHLELVLALLQCTAGPRSYLLFDRNKIFYVALSKGDKALNM